MKSIISSLLFAVTVAVNAAEQSQSIMFKDKNEGKYDYLTKPPESDSSTEVDECARMSAQIEELRGKPQRRYALMERYRAECQR